MDLERRFFPSLTFLFVSRRIPATTDAYTVLIARARPAHLIRFEVIFLAAAFSSTTDARTEGGRF